MKLNQLRDFIAIADAGSLRAAARELNVSAPALVKSLAGLERELHVSLLTRGSRSMALTDCGPLVPACGSKVNVPAGDPIATAKEGRQARQRG